MLACTFFGHRDSPQCIKPILERAVIHLIEKGVNTFFVGNNGFYDGMVISTLKDLQSKYSELKFFVVLAYLPSSKEFICNNFYNTIFPEGIETVPKKFAIDYRNQWMVKKSDYVIAYVKSKIGGAAKFYELSIRKGKKVINLYDYSLNAKEQTY